MEFQVNSPILFVLVGAIIALVVAQSVFFLVRAVKRAKELGYDAIHDTVHEMSKDEARHGAGFAGLLKRYFGK